MIRTPFYKIEYEWCQYSDDEDSGLFTIRRIVTSDFAKVYSKGEAINLINQLNKINVLNEGRK